MGCRDLASAVATRKLQCELKWCRDIVLMSRHYLEKLVSRHGLACLGHDLNLVSRPVLDMTRRPRVATWNRYHDKGRPFACRDTALSVTTGQASMGVQLATAHGNTAKRARSAWQQGARSAQQRTPACAVHTYCAHNPPTVVHCAVHCLGHCVEHCLWTLFLSHC